MGQCYLGQQKIKNQSNHQITIQNNLHSKPNSFQDLYKVEKIYAQKATQTNQISDTDNNYWNNFDIILQEHENVVEENVFIKQNNIIRYESQYKSNVYFSENTKYLPEVKLIVSGARTSIQCFSVVPSQTHYQISTDMQETAKIHTNYIEQKYKLPPKEELNFIHIIPQGTNLLTPSRPSNHSQFDSTIPQQKQENPGVNELISKDYVLQEKSFMSNLMVDKLQSSKNEPKKRMRPICTQSEKLIKEYKEISQPINHQQKCEILLLDRILSNSMDERDSPSLRSILKTPTNSRQSIKQHSNNSITKKVQFFLPHRNEQQQTSPSKPTRQASPTKLQKKSQNNKKNLSNVSGFMHHL